MTQTTDHQSPMPIVIVGHVDHGKSTLAMAVEEELAKRGFHSYVLDGDNVRHGLNADLATCERRDPKGLYKKAREGQIKQFTGIDAPYEAPENPELIIDTANNDVQTCVKQVLEYIEGKVFAATQIKIYKSSERGL